MTVVLGLLAGSSVAQNKKNPADGYTPVVSLDDKKKKKGDEATQSLPAPPQLPAAVTAETDRLAFQVSPLSSKGLLSQQTRDAVKVLLKSSRGPIVKLRAFVAGSGDLRRVGEIVGEMFQEKHLPLPALSVAQVGALPMEGAQVVIEATEVDHKSVNPNGVAFLVGQPAASVQKSLDQLKGPLASAAIQPGDVLAVTCFVSSLDDQRDTHQLMATNFPSAAIDYVQMQRGPVSPAANCEAVARSTTPPPAGVLPTRDLAVILVTSPLVVVTGMQLAFGSADSDLQLAADRLQKTLTTYKTDFDHAPIIHLYVTSSSLNARVLSIHWPFAATGGLARPFAWPLPFESLPSLDAVFGIDVIAVPTGP